MAKTPLYRVWSDMKRRCNNPNREAYINYGGRGISVCEKWYNFIVFKDWALNNGYSDDLMLDRIDNDGNYEPTNCRFVNRYISELNKRKIKNLDCNIRFHHMKYEVTMRRVGKYYYVGTFDTIEEARKKKLEFVNSGFNKL